MHFFFFFNKRKYFSAFVLLKVALQISLLFHKYKQLAGHLNTTAIAVKVGWEHRCFVPFVSQAMAGAKI